MKNAFHALTANRRAIARALALSGDFAVHTVKKDGAPYARAHATFKSREAADAEVARMSALNPTMRFMVVI